MVPTTVKLDSFLNIDFFGRLKVVNPITVFANKNIHNRNKNQWEEPVVGAIITWENLVGGPFQVDELITGGTSGTIGTVTAVDGGSVTITYTVNHDDFAVGEEITGGTSIATADIVSVGTGSTITHSRDTGGVTLQVGTSSGDSVSRVSHRYIPYIPAKIQFISETALFGEAVTNLERRMGYGYTDNGIFFEQDENGLYFNVRSKTSGSVVNDRIEQADWNVKKFDGEGCNNPLLDITKKVFFFTAFLWQGDGPVICGFMVNGTPIVAHRFEYFGKTTVPFMSTPSLPVLYEIKNTGATSSTNTIVEYCTSVVSEGGEKNTGVGFTVSRGISAKNVSTTLTPVLAIRLKNSFGGGHNRKNIQFSNASTFVETNNAHFELHHIHDPTGITATWADIGGGSAVEYSLDISAVTGNPSHPIEEGYAPAGGAPGKGGNENVVEGDKLDQHRIATQNIDSTNSEMFVLYAQSTTATSDIRGHMSWVEFD